MSMDSDLLYDLNARCDDIETRLYTDERLGRDGVREVAAHALSRGHSTVAQFAQLLDQRTAPYGTHGTQAGTYHEMLRALVEEEVLAILRRGVHGACDSAQQLPRTAPLLLLTPVRKLIDSVLEAIATRHGRCSLGALMRHEPNRDGFLVFDPRHDCPTATIPTEHQHYTLLGEDTSVVMGWRNETRFESRLNIHQVTAEARVRDRLVAILQGYVLRNHYRRASDFYWACEEHSAPLARVGHYAMNEGGGLANLFGAGQVFYLGNWEVARAHRGRGLGARTLIETLEWVRSLYPDVTTLAVALSPHQYGYPAPRTLPLEYRDAWRLDRGRLRAYFDRIDIASALCPHRGRVVHFDAESHATSTDERRRVVPQATAGEARCAVN